MIREALSKIVILLAVLAIFTTFGCVEKKNVTKTMHASLDSATTLYETTYDMLKELDKLDRLSEDKKPEIREIMIKVEATLKVAVSALDKYVELSNIEDKNSFDRYILQISSFIREVVALIEEEE